MNWLLNDWTQMEASVVQSWRPPKRRRPVQPGNRWTQRVVFAGALLLGANVYLPTLQTNSPSHEVSITGSYGLSSVHSIRPPLEDMLADRFSDTWTPTVEDSLLTRFAQEKTRDRDHSAELTETVYFNQLEYPEQMDQRVDRGRIARMAKRPKHS